MYEVIGDSKSQSDIRNSSAEAKHCHFLEASPYACDVLPEIAGLHAGKPCPNNPYLKSEFMETFENISKYKSLLKKAFYLQGRVMIGQLPCVDDLTPEEYRIAILMKQHLDAQRDKVNTGSMMRAAFGGGDAAD